LSRRAVVSLAMLGLLCDMTGLAAQQPSQRPPASTPADVSVALRMSTLGVGIEIGKLLTDHLGARVGANYSKVSTSKAQSDIAYDLSLKFHAVSALLDLYPGNRGSFHVTGGVMTNPVTVSATGQPTGGTFTLNGTTYPSSQVGTLTASLKFPSVAPYLGLGFGTAARGAPVFFAFDLGAVLGQPTITLDATGTACGAGTACAANLQAQADTTQHDVRKYLKVYPVVSLGIGLRF